MSYLRLNIMDREGAMNGQVHGYFGDAVIASLTAEPETIKELEAAVPRFIKFESGSDPFSRFEMGEDLQPYDAGLVVVDLAARIVMVDSAYSQPSGEGSFRVQSDFAEEDVWVPYRLSDDWLFVSSIGEYEGVRKARLNDRLRATPLDTREVLLGRPLVEFIARECLESQGSDDPELFTKIHAKWLMTPREDLQAKTPREILLEKKNFIDLDLQFRELQWSLTGECPPPLSTASNAYRFSGYGTHQLVIYYDLIRYLLHECFEGAEPGSTVADRVARLEAVKNSWLESPSADLSGRIPSKIMDLERRRMSITVSAREAIIDEDCEICQEMAAEFATPCFWHLDGCNMDEGFEFSFYRTREEFDAEEASRKEFNRQFEEDWKAGKYNDPSEAWPGDPDEDVPF